MFHLEEDILVSDAQSPEHLNTNVEEDGMTWQDGLTWQDLATSEFVLDCNGATLDNSLTFSDRSPMSPVGTYVNNFLSQVPPQRMLTDPNSISDFNCLRYPLVYDFHSRENLCQLPPQRRVANRTITLLLKSFREINRSVGAWLENSELKSLTYPLVYDCHSRENLCQFPPRRRVAYRFTLSLKRLRELWVSKCGPLEILELESLSLCTTPEECLLELRFGEIMQICEPAGSQSGPEALPDGEMIQVDSLQLEEIVECDATNNGGNVGGEGPSLTAITFSKKNKIKMSERKCTTDKSIGLVDLQQCYGMKREVAANRLGVSLSTFKRRCRENGIPRWPSHKINKDKQSLSTSTRKGVTRSGWTDLPCSDPGSKQAMATLSCPMPHVGAKQDTKKVTIKAEYGEDKIRFQISSTSGIDELKEEVTKRLMLKANTFNVKYKDDEGDWVLIACDADLQDSMNISSSSANNKIRLLVHDRIDNSRNSTKSCKGLKRKGYKCDKAHCCILV